MEYQVGKKEFPGRIVVDVPSTSAAFIGFYFDKQKELVSDYRQLSLILQRAADITETPAQPVSEVYVYNNISLDKCLDQFTKTEWFKERWARSAFAIKAASCVPSIEAVFPATLTVSDLHNGVIMLQGRDTDNVLGAQPAFERSRKPIVFDFHDARDFAAADKLLKQAENVGLQSTTLERSDFFKIFLNGILRMGITKTVEAEPKDNQ